MKLTQFELGNHTVKIYADHTSGVNVLPWLSLWKSHCTDGFGMKAGWIRWHFAISIFKTRPWWMGKEPRWPLQNPPPGEETTPLKLT